MIVTSISKMQINDCDDQWTGRRDDHARVEHHRTGQDLGHRIGDSASGDVRCRAVHRFEHRRELPLRVDVARRSDAQAAGQRSHRGEVLVAGAVRTAVETVLAEGKVVPPDLGGQSDTDA